MTVSLVIPGRNCASTLRACLEAVRPLLQRGELAEIIFVDDGSTDDSAKIATEFPVRIVRGSGGGAGAARNLGWRAATTELVWFIDSDCVAHADALARLLPHLKDERVVAAGGSYGNMRPDSLVASLIHEEIVARHGWMPESVNFLATFNVVYRRAALEQVGGFDELRYNGPGVAAAEDAELAFRLVRAGGKLRFERASIVRHFHPTHYGRYLRVQQRHGFYRMRLYLDYPERTPGDSYSGLVDHVQPPLAMLALLAAPLALAAPWGWLAVALLLLLALLQLPMTARLVARTGRWKYLAYIPFGFLRAFRRGFGMTVGVFDVLLRRPPASAALLRSPSS